MISKDLPEGFSSKATAVGCYIQHDGRFLMLRRALHDTHQAGRWGLPAGGIDPGETEHDCIVREIREEIGLTLQPDDLVYYGKVYVNHPHSPFIFHMFQSDMTERPNVVISPEEHIDFVWVTAEEALELDLVEGGSDCIKLVYNL